MLRRFSITMLLCVAANQSAIGQSGAAGFEFLRTHVGARPAAMGGNYVAYEGDIHSLFYNPAGLATLNQRTASFSYLNHLLDFNSGFVGYVHPLAQGGNAAVGLHYLDYGSFDRMDENGDQIGEFGAASFALIGSYSATYRDQVAYGISGKYIRSSIDNYSSDAFALDLGLIWQAPFQDDLNVGLSVMNLGKARTAFIETREDLPMLISAGFAKTLAHLPLQLGLTLNKFSDTNLTWSLGGEFTLNPQLFLRLGYNSNGRQQKVGGNQDRIAGMNIGLGFLFRQYKVDYGVSSFGEVGALNRISISASL